MDDQTESNEKILAFDAPDEALERASNEAATSVALATWQSSQRSFAPHPC
jgi:hypothetical protein